MLWNDIVEFLDMGDVVAANADYLFYRFQILVTHSLARSIIICIYIRLDERVYILLSLTAQIFSVRLGKRENSFEEYNL